MSTPTAAPSVGMLSDIRTEPQGLEARVKFWRERSDKLAAMYGTLEQTNRELLEALKRALEALERAEPALWITGTTSGNAVAIAQCKAAIEKERKP